MATTDIRVNLGITADNAKALASINGVKAAFDGVAGAASKADTAGTLPNTQRQLNAIRSTLATFRQLLVAYAAFRVGASIVSSVTQAIDKFTLLDARMKAAAGSTAKAAQAYEQLSAVSRETAVPVADLANFFARTSDAVVQYGQAGVTAVDLTRSVALGLKASGASASEAASAFLQFSQAINSGRLAGEEFRAIYEAAPRLVQAYAKALGISVGRLYELSKAQQLTTDKLINATTEVNAILAEEAAKVPATIASATEAVSNAFGQVLARGANLSGLVATITTGLKFLEENAEGVLKALVGITAGAVIGGLTGLAFAIKQVGVAAAFTAVSTAAAANPLLAFAVAGAIVGGVALVSGALDGLGKNANAAAAATAELATEQKKLGDALATAEIRLVDAKKALADFDKEQSVEGLKKQLEQANDALQVTNSEIGNLQSAWAKATQAADKYRQKALDIQSSSRFKGKDRARAGLPEGKAQLDASVEYGSNYFKLQGLITEIQALVGKGDEDSLRQARALGDQAENLADRQQALIDQLKPSDAESAAARVAKQTAQLFDTLAALEDQQAQTAAQGLAEAELQFILLNEKIDALKAGIQEIKDTDLVLKRVTLVEQLDAAIAKVGELEGRLAAISGPNPLDTLGTAQRPIAEALIEKGIKPEVAVTLVPAQTEDEFNAEVSRLLRAGLSAIEKGLPVEQVTSDLSRRLADAGIDIPITADAAQAQASITAVLAQVKPPTVVVPVVYQPVGNFTDDGRQIIRADQNAPAFASGGAIKPPNAVDNLLGWFNKDEFVMRAAAVRKYGSNFMQSVNSLKLPAYAAGGPVGTPINIHLDGHSYPMTAQPSVAKELGRLLGNEVLKRGRR